MATISWLAAALRADGYIPVREQDGWKARGRPGSFNPVGVLLHHTGAKASASNPAPSLTTVVHGRSDLPGPLCHVLVDYDGVCRVIAAGRANHAGQARTSGPVPSGDGNALYVGIEIDYSGSQSPSPTQAANVVNAAAVILYKLGRTSQSCRCHLETSITGKWDPGHTWTPSQWRSMVHAWKAHRWGTSTSRMSARSSPESLGANASSLDVLRQEILSTGPQTMDQWGPGSTLYADGAR